tara:strand:- start:47 stop:598 length:552 start_codon:yes stop_codon:yes gene_type:complete
MGRKMDKNEFHWAVVYFKPINLKVMEEALWIATTVKKPLYKKKNLLRELCLKHAKVTETVRRFFDYTSDMDFNLYQCPLCSSSYKQSWYGEYAWRSSVCDEINEGLSKLPCVSEIDKNLPHTKYEEEERKVNILRHQFLDKYREHRINTHEFGFDIGQLENHYCDRKTPSNYCQPFKLLTEHF